jgi:hypothetical protein
MSEYDPTWMGPDLDQFTSLIASDEVATTETVPKEQIPTSGLSANEIETNVRERLQRAREQREANLLEESRPTARVLKYLIQQKQSQDTQMTGAQNRGIKGTSKASDLEEEQDEESEKESEEGSEKELKEKPKKKEKGSRSKQLRLWQPGNGSGPDTQAITA